MKAAFLCLLGCLVFCPPAMLRAQDGSHSEKPKHSNACPTECTICVPAITSALEFLKKNQQEDGSFESGARFLPEGDRERGRKYGPGTIMTVCLSGMAFMAQGSTIQKGKYKTQIALCKKFVIKHIRPYIGKRADSVTYVLGNPTWTLAYAGIFLSEVYEDKKESNLKAVLINILRSLMKHRNKFGGWGHGLFQYVHSGVTGPLPQLAYSDLIAATNLCTFAVYRMKAQGVRVNGKVLEDLVAYYKAGVHAEGGFLYSVERKNSSWMESGRSCGAMLALKFLGAQEAEPFAQSREYCLKNMRTLHKGHGSSSVGVLNGALMAHFYGGKEWKAFTSAYRKHSLDRQRKDGGFDSLKKVMTLEALKKDPNDFQKDCDDLLGRHTITASIVLGMQLPLGHINWFPEVPAKKK